MAQAVQTKVATMSAQLAGKGPQLQTTAQAAVQALQAQDTDNAALIAEVGTQSQASTTNGQGRDDTVRAADYGTKPESPAGLRPETPPQSPNLDLPPPPADPPVPDDVAKYGSQTGPFDKFKATMNKAEAEALVKGYFNAHGYELSNSMMDHYLANTGNPFTLPDSSMNTIVNDAGVVPTIRRDVNSSVQQAVANAASDPTLYGKPQAITTPYSSVLAQDPDITCGIGHFSVSTSALVTVNPPDAEGRVTYSMSYRTNVYDYYYFHQSENWGSGDPLHGAKQSVDSDMRQLESAGWAKSYRVYGSSGVSSLTGTYGG
ncbi:hypothetical protein [Mycobacterium branderi]|uniref:Uncharacterized protein n=1 Tax=Mycobacterium branderi TaxID=43348 RepID=A0AA91RH63_9MYCO|nr:hypothetical protein [Mycobacterium branderi]MCV7236227.1 hypothetical protein [Mycobacterium branderi]ORA35414.1 hypothetical protein BST20_17590 [Mycobacterium branderi]